MSDIARVYPGASAPGLISGTPASDALGAGQVHASPRSSNGNANLAVVTDKSK